MFTKTTACLYTLAFSLVDLGSFVRDVQVYTLSRPSFGSTWSDTLKIGDYNIGGQDTRTGLAGGFDVQSSCWIRRGITDLRLPITLRPHQKWLTWALSLSKGRYILSIICSIFNLHMHRSVSNSRGANGMHPDDEDDPQAMTANMKQRLYDLLVAFGPPVNPCHYNVKTFIGQSVLRHLMDQFECQGGDSLPFKL